MGYTHRWRMPNEISVDIFQKITSDMRKMIPRLEHLGIVFAGPDGEGQVIIKGLTYNSTFCINLEQKAPLLKKQTVW